MIKKKEFLWNAVGSIIFSMFSAIVLMACTRLNGVELAGIFSICYATTCLLNAVGDLGLRIVQTTDTNRKYEYKDYFWARILAGIAMIIVAAIFAIVTGYSNEKLYIFAILVLIKTVDNISETFEAEFQLNNRLDLAGKSLIYRNVLELLVFILLDKFVGNIYISFGGMLLASVIILFIYEIRNICKFQKEKISYDFKNIKEILKEAYPLGISTLVSTYVINAVKYAIERHKDNAMQTYFNILYMPTFVLNMLSIILLKPFLKVFGEYWNNKEYSRFLKLIIILNAVLVVCTGLGEVLCAFIGIPMLIALYKVDLSKYKMHLLLMILAGLFYAMTTIMFYALGTMRKQKITTLIYTLTSIFAFIVTTLLVKNDIIMGATISNLCIMIFLFIGMTGAFVYHYKKARKQLT